MHTPHNNWRFCDRRGTNIASNSNALLLCGPFAHTYIPSLKWQYNIWLSQWSPSGLQEHLVIAWVICHTGRMPLWHSEDQPKNAESIEKVHMRHIKTTQYAINDNNTACIMQWLFPYVDTCEKRHTNKHTSHRIASHRWDTLTIRAIPDHFWDV